MDDTWKVALFRCAAIGAVTCIFASYATASAIEAAERERQTPCTKGQLHAKIRNCHEPGKP